MSAAILTAEGIKVHPSFGARTAGVAIKAHRSSMAKATRGKFERPQSILWRAARLFNRKEGWNHPVFGRGSTHFAGGGGNVRLGLRKRRMLTLP